MKKELLNRNIRQDFIFKGAGLGAWDWWLDDNRVTFDQRWCEMIGLDITSTPMHLSIWESRVHPDDKEKVYAEIDNYLQGKTALYESVHRIRHANGHWVWILDRGRVSEYDDNGKPYRFTGTHLEITKSKMIEAQLEEAQQVARIGSWSFDLKSQQINWSKQMFSLFKENPDDGPPSYTDHLNSIHPEDREIWQKTVSGSITTGESYRFRFRTVSRQNEVTWIEALGRVNRDIDGVIVGLSGTCQDVSYLVNVEEKNKKEKVKIMQNSKLASLGEMSAGIAHEINNPLAIIAGTLQIIKMEKLNYEDSLPSYDVIEKSTERISKIVKGLKKFSRTDDKSNFQLNSLNQIIEESLLLLNLRAKQMTAVVNFKSSGQIFVNCDEIEIQQVVINLVNNSLDAIKGLAVKTIDIHLEEKDNIACLIIKDSGKRIEEKYVKKIFEPFFTTKNVGEGTGLGLSIVKGILDEHDASIDLLMDEPCTCFEIKFKLPEIS